MSRDLGHRNPEPHHFVHAQHNLPGNTKEKSLNDGPKARIGHSLHALLVDQVKESYRDCVPSIRPILLAAMGFGFLTFLVRLAGLVNVSTQSGVGECRSAVFNFSTWVIPTTDQSCPDACASSFKSFQEILDDRGSVTRYPKHQEKLKRPALEGSSGLADTCIYYKRICFNGRLARKNKVHIVALLDKDPTGINRHAQFRRSSASNSQNELMTSPGCQCIQSLAMFLLVRHNIPLKTRPACLPREICLRMASFVNDREKSARENANVQLQAFREWQCETTQIDIFSEPVTCKPPPFTPWCAQCNPNTQLLARSGVRPLKCPVLIPYNREALQEYENQRIELQKQYAAEMGRAEKPQEFAKPPKPIPKSQTASPYQPLSEQELSRIFSYGRNVDMFNWPSEQDYSTTNQGMSGLPHSRLDQNTASTSHGNLRDTKRPKMPPFSNTHHAAAQGEKLSFQLTHWGYARPSVSNNLESLKQPWPGSGFSFATTSSHSQPQKSIELTDTVAGPEVTVPGAAAEWTDRGSYVLLSSDSDMDCQCEIDEAPALEDKDAANDPSRPSPFS